MLTDEQARFVDAPGGELVLVSCPGSGKTFTGVRRFLSRARTQQGTAYLSFTRVAAAEARLAASSHHDVRLLLSPNFIGTIDAFVRQHLFNPFIRCLVPGAAVPDVIVPGSYVSEEIDVAANWVSEPGGRPYKAWEIKLRGDANGFRFVLDNNSPLPAGISAARVFEAKRRYLEAGIVTHNDILVWSLEILRSERLRAAGIVANCFPEIIVDEAQDTSRLQQEILGYLEQAGTSVAYIGDPLQSIYTFNDADATMLENSADRQRFILSINKRSSTQVVSFVNAIYATAMSSEFSTIGNGLGVQVIVGSPRECAARFQELVAAASIPFSDAAIVVRSNELRSDIAGAIDPESPFSRALKRLLTALVSLQDGNIEDAARFALDFLRSVLRIDVAGDREREEWQAKAWTFLRAGVPAFDEDAVEAWLEKLRESVIACAARYGVEAMPNLGAKLQRRGIGVELARDLLNSERPPIRVRTVHGVKGESIDAVLLFGTARHHRAWIEGRRTEDGLLGYVGMTRARRLLVLGCADADTASKWDAELAAVGACLGSNAPVEGSDDNATNATAFVMA